MPLNMPDNTTDQNRLEQIRRDFVKEELSEEAVHDHPIDQFEEWFEHALSANLLDANAMTLATSSKNGKPSSRIVLLKGLTSGVFVFIPIIKAERGKSFK